MRIRTEITGRRTAVEGRDALVLERSLPAALEQAWAAISTDEGLSPWIGELETTPAEDGGLPKVRFRMTSASPDAEWDDVDLRACEPRERVELVTANGWHLGMKLAATGPESAALRFVHRLPEPSDLEGVDWIGIGWEYYLDRLERSLAGDDPGEISWERGGYEELRREYGDLFGLRADSDAAAVLDAVEAERAESSE